MYESVAKYLTDILYFSCVKQLIVVEIVLHRHLQTSVCEAEKLFPHMLTIRRSPEQYRIGIVPLKPIETMSVATEYDDMSLEMLQDVVPMLRQQLEKSMLDRNYVQLENVRKTFDREYQRIQDNLNFYNFLQYRTQ